MVARLLFDFASTTPDPADLQRYMRVMIAEIERVITRYYEAGPPLIKSPDSAARDCESLRR